MKQITDLLTAGNFSAQEVPAHMSSTEKALLLFSIAWPKTFPRHVADQSGGPAVATVMYANRKTIHGQLEMHGDDEKHHNAAVQLQVS